MINFYKEENEEEFDDVIETDNKWQLNSQQKQKASTPTFLKEGNSSSVTCAETPSPLQNQWSSSNLQGPKLTAPPIYFSLKEVIETQEKIEEQNLEESDDDFLLSSRKQEKD